MTAIPLLHPSGCNAFSGTAIVLVFCAGVQGFAGYEPASSAGGGFAFPSSKHLDKGRALVGYHWWDPLQPTGVGFERSKELVCWIRLLH